MTERSTEFELTTADGEVLIVADAHLAPGDSEAIATFCRFLQEQGSKAATVVLLGDLFALWIGHPAHLDSAQLELLAAVDRVRQRGVSVLFFEGNREFGVGRWQRRRFDAVLEGAVLTDGAGKRWWLAHGDRLDRSDRSHQWFQQFVRSAPVLELFSLLPRRWGRALARRLERSLRHRQLQRKRSIGTDRLARLARAAEERGCDGAIVGHLHVETDYRDPQGCRLLVLPDWRTTQRYLRVAEGSAPEFAVWGDGVPYGPALIAVEERPEESILEFEIDPKLSPDDRIVLNSGHGSGDRSARVKSRVEGRPSCYRVELAPGPPLQVGDRLLAGKVEPS